RSQALPVPAVEITKCRRISVIMMCLSVMSLQRSLVLATPVGLIVDPDLVQALGKLVEDWHSQILPALRRSDAIAILPFVLLKLNGVQEHKDVCTIQFIKIAQPGQILGLMDRDTHRLALHTKKSLTADKNRIADDSMITRTDHQTIVGHLASRRRRVLERHSEGHRFRARLHEPAGPYDQDRGLA